MRAPQRLQPEGAVFPRVEPPCGYVGACGGCTLQHLRYDDQLAVKRQHVARLLAGLGQEIPPVTIEGPADPWRYRNKAEFTFGERQGQLLLGYHAAGSFWRVVDLDDCLLLPQAAMRIVREVHAQATATGLPCYHPRTHQGFFRFLLIRHSQATGQVMLCLMTTRGHQDVIERIAQTVVQRHPQIAGFLWGVTERLADVAVPETVTVLHGTDLLEDQVGSFRLHLKARSFLQPTNTLANRLYTSLCDALRDTSRGAAWDLYCGVGVIALYLARQQRMVYGIDVEAEHLELATRNAHLNGLTNVEFRLGRVEEVLRDRRFWLQEAKPEVIVVDPPRAGLHPHALSGLLAARPAVVAYISCNPLSLVRDLRELLRSFPRYRLRLVNAFDLFPQTNHLEVLTVLDRC